MKRHICYDHDLMAFGVWRFTADDADMTRLLMAGLDAKRLLNAWSHTVVLSLYLIRHLLRIKVDGCLEQLLELIQVLGLSLSNAAAS